MLTPADAAAARDARGGLRVGAADSARVHRARRVPATRGRGGARRCAVGRCRAYGAIESHAGRRESSAIAGVRTVV